jgi:hypothetical protein
MFIYYISATLYIGTNRVPPTPYTLPLRKDESTGFIRAIENKKECGNNSVGILLESEWGVQSLNIMTGNIYILG